MVLSLSLLLTACSTLHTEKARGAFPEEWINGTAVTEPKLQVQRYDRDTFVIRQSILTNFEAPFIYLLFGRDRALLLDTGAGNVAIRPTVDRLIEERRKANGGRSISLVVAHSHAHEDHIAGDAEFAGRADTRIVGTSPAEVASFFELAPWPENIAVFDLGDRPLDIIATPGHESAHIMLFDRRTRILFSGDALYPGRLYYKRADLPIYRASVRRAINALRGRQIAWIMGAHIELNKAGDQFPAKAPVHPDERRLELSASALPLLLDRLLETSDQSGAVNAGEFVLFPY
jgi:glyoxylase-like metal-dependent hydrolase (beta-lactamase superfamily II)